MSGKCVGGLVTYQSELYLMDSDGSDKTRLTHFTDSSYPEYIQDTVVTPDHYWSPDGRRIFGFVHYISNGTWPAVLYQIEFNGPCGLSSMTGSQAAEADPMSPGASPNPANDRLTVTVPPFIEGGISVEIMNALGQRVYFYKANANPGTISVDVSAFPSGPYFLRLTSQTNFFLQQTAVISH